MDMKMRFDTINNVDLSDYTDEEFAQYLLETDHFCIVGECHSHVIKSFEVKDLNVEDN